MSECPPTFSPTPPPSLPLIGVVAVRSDLVARGASAHQNGVSDPPPPPSHPMRHAQGLRCTQACQTGAFKTCKTCCHVALANFHPVTLSAASKVAMGPRLSTHRLCSRSLCVHSEWFDTIIFCPSLHTKQYHQKIPLCVLLDNPGAVCGSLSRTVLYFGGACLGSCSHRQVFLHNKFQDTHFNLVH